MIVLDTSAAVEVLLGLPLSRRVEQVLDHHDWQIAAPQLLTVEVLQVLRRRVGGRLNAAREAEAALELFEDLGIRFFGHEVLSARIWSLRDNVTAYDASYVALAELLEVELLTSDARLAAAPGHAAVIRLLEA